MNIIDISYWLYRVTIWTWLNILKKKPPVRIRSEDQYKSMAFLVAFPHLSHNLLDCMDLLKDPPSEKFSTDSLPPLPQVVDAWQTKIINPGISWIITQVYHGIIMVWRCFLLTSRWKRAKSTIFTEGIFFFFEGPSGDQTSGHHTGAWYFQAATTCTEAGAGGGKVASGPYEEYTSYGFTDDTHWIYS